jgi:hypothetical protein
LVKEKATFMHVHLLCLSAFCVARKVPDTRILPKAYNVCREVYYSKYALPGSIEEIFFINPEYAIEKIKVRGPI